MAESIYTIGGRKYAFDEPLTPEELRELQEKFGGAPTATKPAPAPAPAATPVAKEPVAEKPQEDAGVLEYLWNAAKKGVTGTTSMLGAAYETGTEMTRKLEETAERARRERAAATQRRPVGRTIPLPSDRATGFRDVVSEPSGIKERMEILRQNGYFPTLADLAEKYGQQQRAAARITGARDLTAPGPITEILGAGVEAAADPLGLIGKAKPLLIAGRSAGEFLTGMAADIGGRLGSETEKAITGGEESGIGRLSGALLGGGASAAQRQTLGTLADEAIKKVRDISVKGKTTAAEQEYVTGAAKRLLEIASQEQGAKSIDDLLKEASSASTYVSGKDAPLLVAMADNPVIRQQVIRLAKNDATFRQQVNETLSSLRGDMRAKVEKIFGVRYEPKTEGRSIFEPGYVPGKEPLKGLDLPQLTADVAERREVLTRRIEDIASGFDPSKSKEEIGSDILRLIEDKKKLARSEVSPEYEKLLKDARTEGIKMPKEGVGTIYDFVRKNNLRDIFGKGTDLDRQIMTVLKPKEFPVPGTGETVTEHLPMSFDNVESLKKAINELKRQRMSEDSMRKVIQLEGVVDKARETIPGDFSKRLNNIDIDYYKKIGIPYGAQGIKDIDSKRYATQVAPIIVKNSESFDQFIRAVGKDDGYKIAEDSIISEIYDKAIDGGVLNSNKLAKYLKDKEGVIRQIPGLEERLKTALTDDSQLKARVNQLDDAAKAATDRIAQNALTKFDAPNYNALARSFMGDPKSREKLLRDISDLNAESARAVRRTLRAEVIDLADNNPSGFMDYLMNPVNKDALDKIFGSAFQPSLRKVGLLADKISKADISKVNMDVGKQKFDALEKVVPGNTLANVMSVVRDRIASIPQKITILLSRVNNARLTTKTDEAIKELLLDPNGVQKLANVASDINFSMDLSGQAKKLGNVLSDVMPRAFYTSGKTAVAGEEREQRTQEIEHQKAADLYIGGFEDEGEEPVQSAAATPEAPTEVPEEAPKEGAESYSYENLTSNQRNELGRYLDSLGINKDFLMNAQTFNSTPVEKRKQLFDRFANRNMANGGLVEPGNIDVSKLPKVRNPDGSYSTVLTIGIEQDGKHYVIPTVINGRVVSEKEAVDYFNKTRKHLGAFGTQEESDAYAQRLHDQEAQRIKKARGGVAYTPQEELLLRRYASR